ncbi:MAG TPA: hypothetical protein VGR73_08520 [Bryobacteraceae bacterium]|nr:hypothetical protein [Bryobacteraceae bacterium]
MDIVQDLGGNGTQQQSSKGAMAVGRHHDQVDVPILRALNDVPRRVSFRYQSAHMRTRKLLSDKTVECDCRRRLQPTDARRNGLTPGVRRSSPRIGDIHDVQNDDFRIEAFGHRPHEWRYRTALSRKIHRK